jgi:hypothetical protein
MAGRAVVQGVIRMMVVSKSTLTVTAAAKGELAEQIQSPSQPMASVKN